MLTEIHFFMKNSFQMKPSARLLFSLFLCFIFETSSSQSACYPYSFHIIVSGSGNKTYDVANGTYLEHLSHSFSFEGEVFASNPVFKGDSVDYTIDSCIMTFIYAGDGLRELFPGFTQTTHHQTNGKIKRYGAAEEKFSFSLKERQVNHVLSFTNAFDPNANNVIFEGFQIKDFGAGTFNLLVYIDPYPGWAFEDILITTGFISGGDYPDSYPPVAVCRDTVIQLDETCTAAVQAADLNNGSEDNCSISDLSYALDKELFGLDDVGINAVNIGEGMVNDVVFGLPEESVGPQKIEGVAQDVVDRIVVRIAAVTGIVTNIKAQ